jgi:hypothetical protein
VARLDFGKVVNEDQVLVVYEWASLDSQRVSCLTLLIADCVCSYLICVALRRVPTACSPGVFSLNLSNHT